MADIRTYPLARHLRGTATMHVRLVRRGKLVRDGTGLSFFYRPLSAVLSEVPVDDRELPLLFHARTADFQDLAVQASVTFRVTDPATVCARIDFSIHPDTGRWRGTPLEQVAGLLTETAQQHVLGLIAARPLAGVLADGVEQIRDKILIGLTTDQRLQETGIAVIGARVVAIRPEPELEKALRTPAREQIQQDADRATYERRALAVERERAIAENELANQIELARREEQLIGQRGTNARRQAQEAAAANGIEADARAARQRLLDEAKAVGTRSLGEARAAGRGRLCRRILWPGTRHPARPRSQRSGRQPAANREPGSCPGAADPAAGQTRRRTRCHCRRHNTRVRVHGRRAMTLPPRAVLVHRRTELQELLARHGTRGQAEFFLRTRGRRIEDAEARHHAITYAIKAVSAAIPAAWRRAMVERAELPTFLFEPGDIIVVAGQDGLVANLAKYLQGQVVIGINPEPGRNPGVLVPHPPEAVQALLATAASPGAANHVENLAMVQARTDDGQRLVALNEIYIGQPSHQTARYAITLPDARAERQASSGLIVSTGTGATGWCRSAWLERHSSLLLPSPAEPRLAWFVREAWPSPATGTTYTEGELANGQMLSLTAESDRLVLFGDGIETDSIQLNWGQAASFSVADRTLRMLR